MQYKKLLLMGICILSLVGCGSQVQDDSSPNQEQDTQQEVEVNVNDESHSSSLEDQNANVEEEGDSDQETVGDSSTDLPANSSDETDQEAGKSEDKVSLNGEALLASNVNESGEVMVIMYHNLGEKNTDYARTVESFKADLERLYNMGFRTISMQDYIDGHYDVPLGKTPVVLTFDDGHQSNFNFLDDGSIDPNCVVGILNAFYEEHPDFGKHAIFYLNGGDPFGQSDLIDQKLSYLLENGYEIGNHTTNHAHLNEADAALIQKEIGGNANAFHALNENIVMNSLALPYGQRPEDEYLRSLIESGSYEGQTYENKVILLVGWRPHWPLYNTGVSHTAVNRVQSGDAEYQLTWWLDNYEANDSRRFYSDGDASVITVPEEAVSDIDTSKTNYPVQSYNESGEITSVTP